MRFTLPILLYKNVQALHAAAKLEVFIRLKFQEHLVSLFTVIQFGFFFICRENFFKWKSFNFADTAWFFYSSKELISLQRHLSV